MAVRVLVWPLATVALFGANERETEVTQMGLTTTLEHA